MRGSWLRRSCFQSISGGRRSSCLRCRLACTRPRGTSVSQILAWPLWTQQKGVVLLANFSGQPTEKLVVQFRSPVPVSKVRSLRTGEVRFTKDQREYKLTMPMGEVTDVLVVE